VNVERAYRANYERIAHDHVEHWRAKGSNPFQEWRVLARNENETVSLALRHLAPDGVLLDAGCGMGDLLMRFPEHERYGIDLAAEYVQIARERGLDAREGKLERLPWPRATFDLAFVTDVLEHVLDLNRVVRELLRVLKRGGVVIARTPNDEVLTYETAPYEFVHLRRFDEVTLRLLFGKIFGCEVLEAYPVEDTIHIAARKC
jgi:SAM-dependent methyltransferase